MGEFSDAVFEAVRRIPCGKVATYGQIARMVGRPRSARYVGFALRGNPHPGTGPGSVPCHRVVFKDGSLCKSFAFGGPDAQFDMLRQEGARFSEAPARDGREGAGRVRMNADLDDGKGLRPVFLEDIHVDMAACQWDGRSIDGDDGLYPTQPPADFDWKAEMGE